MQQPTPTLERPERPETEIERNTADFAWRALGSWRAFLIAIDGVDGAGKSTLGRYLAWKLGMPLVETDLYLTGDGFAYHDDDLRKVIEHRLKANRPVIVEGIFVLDRLAELGLTADWRLRVVNHDRTEGSQRFNDDFEDYFQHHPDADMDHVHIIGTEE